MDQKNSPTVPVTTSTDGLENARVILVDTDGNPAGSTSTGVAVTEYTEGATVASGSGVLSVGKNGTTIKAIQTDASGNIVESNSAAIKTAVETIDNAISGTEMQVDVVAPLPAGTNNIGDVDVLSITNGSLNGPGSPTIDSYTQAAISASANTANQTLIAAPGANKQIWVYGIQFAAGTGDGSYSIQDEDDTAITGVVPVAQYSGLIVSPSGNFAMPLWKVATNKALEVDTVTASLAGSITYAIVSV